MISDPALPLYAHRRIRLASGSTPNVRAGEIDDLVAPPAQYSLQHEKREALGHFQGDGRRHRELRSVHHGIDEDRPVMGESGGDAVIRLARIFESNAPYADGLGHGREIRVLQVHSEIEEAGGLLLQLDEAERAVVENHDLDRQLELHQAEQI